LLSQGLNLFKGEVIHSFGPGAYQKMSGLISNERFSLTLTLSRWEREEPLEASGITNGHPARAITGDD
jgi:hypothetical protein